MITKSRICILGGGFGGLYTALHLTRCSWGRSQPQITLVDQKDHFLFTPLFYDLLTEELQAWQIAPAFEKLLAKTTIRFCQAQVEQVDLVNRQVHFSSREAIAYDRLVLGVGRQTRLNFAPEEANNVYTFQTLADLERFKQQLQKLEKDSQKPIRVAIVGAGPSGVELACKLGDRLKGQGQIYLFDRRKTLLRSFSASSQKAACRALFRRGVQVELNIGIEAINHQQITVSHNQQSRVFSVDFTVWTTGTQTWPWLKDLGCAQNEQGQLLTRKTLQLFDFPEVFAIGDLASIQAVQPVPSTAQAALQESKVVARNLWASLNNKPLKPFRYKHLGEMLTLGINTAVISSFGICLEGYLAFLIRRWTYLLRLPTFWHRLSVGRHWLIGLLISR